MQRTNPVMEVCVDAAANFKVMTGLGRPGLNEVQSGCGRMSDIVKSTLL